VLSAHCRHLGAHIGHGGTVNGDRVVCPFHGWEWGPTAPTGISPTRTGRSVVGMPVHAMTKRQPLKRLASLAAFAKPTLMLQHILGEPEWDGALGDADQRGITPLFTSNNPYGDIQLDTNRRLALGDTSPERASAS
jgi:hypothetical protein